MFRNNTPKTPVTACEHYKKLDQLLQNKRSTHELAAAKDACARGDFISPLSTRQTLFVSPDKYMDHLQKTQQEHELRHHFMSNRPQGI